MHLAWTNDIRTLRYLILLCEKLELKLPVENISKDEWKSLMHYVASPYSIGTFEWKQLIEFLCTDRNFRCWNLNDTDISGRRPIDLIKNCLESETF